MFTQTQRKQIQYEIHRRWNPNRRPSPDRPAASVLSYPLTELSWTSLDDLLLSIRRKEAAFSGELPWYKTCGPQNRPEEPAIEEMREKLRQQECEETAPPRFLDPDRAFQSYEAPNDIERAYEQLWYDEMAPSSFLDPDRDFQFYEAPIDIERAYQQLLYELDFPIQQSQDFPEQGLDMQQINTIVTSYAQNIRKRKADPSPSAHKRHKTVADDSDSNPLSFPDHIPWTKELNQPVEDALPKTLGVLARNTGQEVRRRAKTSDRNKTKRTAVPLVQSTQPPNVVDPVSAGFEGAGTIDAAGETTKSPKDLPRGEVLINPRVVIYRDSALHMQHAESLSKRKGLGNSTVDGQKHPNISHPGTKKQKKLAKTKVPQPLLDTKSRVSKTSPAAQKRSRKTHVDTAQKASSRWTRSRTDPHHAKHVALNENSTSIPVLGVTQEVDLTKSEHHIAQTGHCSIFG